MMTENGYGDGRTTRAKMMAEHDALPPTLRRISCLSVAKWCAESIRLAYSAARAKGHNHPRSLALTVKWMADHEAVDTLADYGPNHPEARR